MVTITHVKGHDDLYCHYSRQQGPQPCYVELDCEAEALSADYSTEIGNAVPMEVWHGRTLRWSIPCLTADAANELLDSIVQHAVAILDGYSCEWDGNNHAGRYSDAAMAAMDEVAALCSAAGGDGEEIEEWEASDWFGGIGCSDAQRRALGITAATTDAELDAISDAEEDEASPRRIVASRRHLEWLRDDARENATQE